MIFAACMPSATLGDLVIRIIESSTKEKMLRVATNSVVACVANLKIFWYFPFFKEKSHAMRFYENFCFKPKLTVSSFTGVSGPQPTRCLGRFGNF